MDDVEALAAWIVEAQVAYIWRGITPPPPAELVALAAQALGITLH